jgi:DNA-directed RNA polymerase II subunit RPB2
VPAKKNWKFPQALTILQLLRTFGIESDKAICETISPENLQLHHQMIPSITAAAGILTQVKAKKWVCSHAGLSLEKLDNLLENFLPHTLPGSASKIRNLCHMVEKLFYPPNDRDSYCNKRIDVSGDLLAQLFNQLFIRMIKECTTILKKQISSNKSISSLFRYIQLKIFEQGFSNALSSGKWGTIKNRHGVARSMERLSYMRAVSELRRIITPSADNDHSKTPQRRQVHPTQVGFVCIVETPEGENIGLVKNMTMTATITLPCTEEDNMKIGNLVKASFDTIRTSNSYKIIFNGDVMGWTTDPSIVTKLHNTKLNNHGLRYMGICVDKHLKEICLNTDGGRMTRPVFRTDAFSNPIDKIKKAVARVISWEELLDLKPHIIEYIDIEQQSTSTLTTSLNTNASPSECTYVNVPKCTHASPSECTYAEIDCSLLLGMTATNIPFCNMNQAPRNSYQYNQAKQAIGLYSTNFKKRFDIANILYQPQIPLVSTIGMRYTGLDQMPHGINVILAIACFSGYNQEDSMVLNASSVERGLFACSSLKKYSSTISKNISSSKDSVHGKPQKIRSNVNFETLNERGFAIPETNLKFGDAIIGKVSPDGSDLSEIYKNNDPGVVDYVETGTNADGYDMINVRVRSFRIPIIGDKFSTRSGQKFTCGILMKQEDMPYTEDGIIPDMIINPNCIPRRMTIGQLLESVMGKIGALTYTIQDGTSFVNRDIRKIGKVLESLGYDESGCETMYSGITGEKFPNKVFIGPVYVQRLKHMVTDKIHARAKGPCQLLTRQPLDGRNKNGGLRFGEMEKDCAVSHGISFFLKERMMECSDMYTIEACRTCGLIGTQEKGCCGEFNMEEFDVPYTYKLLCQELLSINIALRIFGHDALQHDACSDGVITQTITLLPHEDTICIAEKIKELEGACIQQGFVEKILCIEQIKELPIVKEDLSCSTPYQVVFSCDLFSPKKGMVLDKVEVMKILGKQLVAQYKCMIIVVSVLNFQIKIGDYISVVIDEVKIIEKSTSIKAFGTKISIN